MRRKLRTLLVEGLEPRQLMTADLTRFSLADMDDTFSAQVAQPSEPVSGNQDLVDYKASTLKSVASLAPQTLTVKGATAKSALSSYIDQLKTPDAASATTATDAAWSDFNSRFDSATLNQSLPQIGAVTIDAVSLTVLPNGGFIYSKESMVDAHGTQGSASGSLTADTALAVPDSAELDLDWDGSGFQLYDYSRTAGHRFVRTADLANDGYLGGSELVKTRDHDHWQFVYSEGGDVGTSLNATGGIDSTGTSSAESNESFSYASFGDLKLRDQWVGGGDYKTDKVRDANYSTHLNRQVSYDPSASPSSSVVETTTGDSGAIACRAIWGDGKVSCSIRRTNP